MNCNVQVFVDNKHILVHNDFYIVYYCKGRNSVGYSCRCLSLDRYEVAKQSFSC